MAPAEWRGRLRGSRRECADMDLLALSRRVTRGSRGRARGATAIPCVYISQLRSPRCLYSARRRYSGGPRGEVPRRSELEMRLGLLHGLQRAHTAQHSRAGQARHRPSVSLREFKHCHAHGPVAPPLGTHLTATRWRTRTPSPGSEERGWEGEERRAGVDLRGAHDDPRHAFQSASSSKRGAVVGGGKSESRRRGPLSKKGRGHPERRSVASRDEPSLPARTCTAEG